MSMKHSRLPDASFLRSTLGRGCCLNTDPRPFARCAKWCAEALTPTKTAHAARGSKGGGRAFAQVTAGARGKPDGRRSFRVRDDTGVQRLRSTLRRYAGSMLAGGHSPGSRLLGSWQPAWKELARQA